MPVLTPRPPTGETPAEKRGGLRIPGFAQLQRLGKSLMLPIALLPAAGILLRLGQDDMLGGTDIPVIGPFFDSMSAAGDGIFGNLAILFAVGVAIGFAKKADGSTALAAVAGYLVMTSVFDSMSPVVLEGVEDAAGDQAMIDYSVFGGIIVGLITAWLFDRYHNIELPPYLGFFGGRRFVPIVVSLTVLFVSFAMAYVYPLFNSGLTSVGQFIAGSGALGAFIYGFANRMLIPLGLHHILNTFIWFIYGDYEGANGLVTGELSRFAAGDQSAGLLTSGFYPVLMFGLPAAALAMIHVAKPRQRTVAVGIFGAASLTAFLTGVTEPLEFAFMFLAFPLYVIHAVLTGLSLAVAHLLDIHLGFSFSAGLIDLLLYGRAPAAHNILLLVAQGLIFAVVYYVMFRFAITRWNLRLPGRVPDDEYEASLAAQESQDAAATGTQRAEQLIAAFGGRDNLVGVDACITRLRMEVADKSSVDKGALSALGAAGVMEVGNNVQAVFGTQSDVLKDEIKAALAGPAPAAAPTAAPEPVVETAQQETPDEAVAADALPEPTLVRAPVQGRTVALSEVPDKTFAAGTVGPGLAIEPTTTDGIVEAVAPVSGKLMQLLPHAYAIMTDDKTAVLVHLGLDTVKLKGEGFTLHAAKGDRVVQGQPVITYDVASVEAAGYPTVVPVVVMDARGATVDELAEPSAPVSTMRPLFTVTKKKK
ncbi:MULTISPECIES: glucose PTS transporter subunit IIA [unclassified Corynebacterium]|uniref:glucose PTS transporter subunit IIA n=1 Tax=unclassified Corynebacterium TaxID=2624378 RepID=UPI004033A983